MSYETDIIAGLDNGHGTKGYTIGKWSPDRRFIEGEWSRIMVPKLADALRDIGIEPYILVPENKDIKLLERCARANKIMKANPGKRMFFLSIHSNAVGSKDEIALANGGWNDKACGFVSYAAYKSSKTSQMLAKNLRDTAVEFGRAGDRYVPSEGFWRAGYTVLTQTSMPAVLTESAFHTNHNDVEYMLSERGQEELINIHLIGICKTFGIPYAYVRG